MLRICTELGPVGTRKRMIRSSGLLAAIAMASARDANTDLITHGTFDQNIDGWSDPVADPNTTIQ